MIEKRWKLRSMYVGSMNPYCFISNPLVMSLWFFFHIARNENLWLYDGWNGEDTGKRDALVLEIEINKHDRYKGRERGEDTQQLNGQVVSDQFYKQQVCVLDIVILDVVIIVLYRLCSVRTSVRTSVLQSTGLIMLNIKAKS